MFSAIFSRRYKYLPLDIYPSSLFVCVDEWTLKQVQGDGYGVQGDGYGVQGDDVVLSVRRLRRL